MELTPDQRSRLDAAMTALFRDYKDLQRFMTNRLAFSLSRAVGTTDLEDAVYQVLEIFVPDTSPATDLSRLLLELTDKFPANQAIKDLVGDLIPAKEVERFRLNKELPANRTEGTGELEGKARMDALESPSNRPLGTDEARGLVAALRRDPELPDSGNPLPEGLINTVRSQTAGYSSANQARADAKTDQVARLSALADRSSGSSAGQGTTLPPSRVRVAEMHSAVKTLNLIRAELDGALKAFVQAQAGGLAPDFGDMAASDVLARVRLHAEDITFADDLASAYPILQQLLVDVQTGIEMAERGREFDIVRQLAGEAANACSRVADVAQDSPAEIVTMLSNVVPYWRMKAAYAEHQFQSRA
jgi:hypothetical protein